MDISKLAEILRNEPAYRLKQAQQAVFQLLIDDWSQAAGLPKLLRQKLAQECPLNIDCKLFESKDGQSTKALVILADGKNIESVLMCHNNRNTVCVSSQVGCPMYCAFCATGKLGFIRNLSSDEIVQQVLLFGRLLKKQGKHVDNVVFMGMGEPFLNYDNVMAAIVILNDKNGLNIGSRHISISTVGVPGGIEKLIDQPPAGESRPMGGPLQVNLAISLHAPNDRLRKKIIPAAKNYPIAEIIKSVLRYTRNTNRRVMLEYVLLDGINDSDADAKELARLIKNHLSLKLAFVNLISYNPTGEFRPSPQKRRQTFKTILEKENIEVTQRYRFGREIKAACGQLAGSNLS